MSAVMQRMVKSRTGLILRHPFFGALALRLKFVETDKVPTMATDGTHLFFNTEFANGLSKEEMEGVICHEVMHNALLHMIRRGKRDPYGWNVACDYAENLILKDCGFTLPADALLDEKWRDITAEAIYDRLPKEDKEGPVIYVAGIGEIPSDKGGTGVAVDPKSNKEGNGKGGDATDGQPSKNYSELEAEWTQAVTSAATAAKMAGNLPGAIGKFATDLIKPQVDWKAALRRFITNTARSDQTWSRPNRRFIGSGLYLPSTHSQNVGTIAIGLDTSGSVSDAELAAFWSETHSLITSMNPERVVVIPCDAQVHDVQEFTRDNVPKQFTFGDEGGRGGTRFYPVWDYIKEKDINPVCALYLTDMEADFGKAPPYPVLWVKSTDHTAPYGQEIKLDIHR